MTHDLHARQKSERIGSWQTMLATLPDTSFFAIMRVYLGEIKTPYNKQRLIEQLRAFFHKAQNQKNIVALLDNFDKKILTAIAFLPDATQSRLVDFFSDEYTRSDVHMRLLNLTERLLIYKDKQQDAMQRICINPLLEDAFAPHLSVSLVVPAAKYASQYNGSSAHVSTTHNSKALHNNMPNASPHDENAICALSPEVIAAFVSYIMEKPDLCKNDGMFKKINKTQLNEIFACGAAPLQLLFTALTNLLLIKQEEKHATVNYERLFAFAELPQKKQYAYVCAASGGHVGRESLRTQAQLLLNVAASMPQTGATRAVLLRLAMLLGNASVPQSRLSKIVARAQNEHAENETTYLLFDRMFDAAETFGLFTATGVTDDNETIYCAAHALLENDGAAARKKNALEQHEHADMHAIKHEAHAAASVPHAAAIMIDAGFNVTLLPGLPLKALLPLMHFLNVTRCDTITKFEITKNSAIRAFDAGYTANTIYALLKKHMSYEVPQNLCMSIEDWQSAYTSALLYKGYVLALDKKNAQRVQKNPNAKKFIHTELAPGIYVLNIHTDDDVQKFINASGFTFMGAVKRVKEDVPPAAFPLIEDGKNFFSHGNERTHNNESFAAAENIINEMHAALKTLSLSKTQKQLLAERIDNKIIVNKTQLTGAALHTEILTASGMDFLGKVRLIESALHAKDLIEVTLPGKNDNFPTSTFLCTPLKLTKETGDTHVLVQLEQTKELVSFSVSRATGVKLIHLQLF
ncbi:MAG: helicase-associated domain-containing protein [Treponema sp.]|nr:helicase-associated domain-containing protein [Treponema sp.]